MAIPVFDCGTVLVAAPPSLHRQGLLATLEEHWPALACTVLPDPDQLPALVRQQAYALVVLDSALGGPPLPEQLRRLCGIRSCQPVLVLTGRRLTPPLRQQLQQAGASALLCHDVAPAALVATISALLTNDAAGGRASAHTVSRTSTPPTPFSTREVEVLRLVVADLCNQEIADKLFLSVRTVESHRRALLQKTGAKTLVGLVVQAVREGWVGM
ncbi:response regulator transcription factor [Hymenobacter psychrotolerans]|uniref:Two component transcriptional regulator, LuxR family n=1 Tax=Hymenobacter psychrotolerans DSM 18569 TaxID=1121959 RepID=A0A1M6PMF8_9BACT|nr:response regulator transcription factor [Hymenobacter psychrotolerans]SHK09057.1 two component transcriptional regulator, LuxR family [Hymenobacter psychrotolerans DSM 18569]